MRNEDKQRQEEGRGRHLSGESCPDEVWTLGSDRQKKWSDTALWTVCLSAITFTQLYSSWMSVKTCLFMSAFSLAISRFTVAHPPFFWVCLHLHWTSQTTSKQKQVENKTIPILNIITLCRWNHNCTHSPIQSIISGSDSGSSWDSMTSILCSLIYTFDMQLFFFPHRFPSS